MGWDGIIRVDGVGLGGGGGIPWRIGRRFGNGMGKRRCVWLSGVEVAEKSSLRVFCPVAHPLFCFS